jgi:hypothetical protein
MRDQADAGGKEAQGSSAAPWIVWAKSGAKAPPTVETLTPTFSNTLPFITPRTPRRPPGEPSASVRSQARYSKRASAAGLGARSPRIRRRCGRAAIQTRFWRPVDVVGQRHGASFIGKIAPFGASLHAARCPPKRQHSRSEIPACIGIRRRRSARSCTSSGTPALSDCQRAWMSVCGEFDAVVAAVSALDVSRTIREPSPCLGEKGQSALGWRTISDRFRHSPFAARRSCLVGRGKAARHHDIAAGTEKQAASRNDRADVSGDVGLVEGDPQSRLH